MNWKEFFKLNLMKFIIFLIVFVFLPFYTYIDLEFSSCIQIFPYECAKIEPHFEFIISPSNTANTFAHSFGASGTEFHDQVVNISRILLITKLTVSYLIACIIFYYYKKISEFLMRQKEL